jgi:hypothetical protein
LNLPSKHDAKFEHFAKCLKANNHAASRHVYPINLPTRLPEDPKKIQAAFLVGSVFVHTANPFLNNFPS